MTAIQTSPTTDSLAEAVWALEAAQTGDLAVIPGREGVSAIRVRDSGTPWLLDPLGHNDGPAYVTTAYLATQGYRTWGSSGAGPAPEPLLDFEEHVAALKADGWTGRGAARATGLTPRSVERAFAGQTKSSPKTMTALYQLVPGMRHPELAYTADERVEDLEFLLLAGVESDEAVERTGFPSADAAQRALYRRGRNDLASLVRRSPREPEDPSLDDYDPYDDPTFKEEA